MKQVDIMKLASNLWKSESYVVQQKYRKEYELLRNAYREKIKVINSFVTEVPVIWKPAH